MQTHRFGRKLKLPSTRAIKREILTLMLQDHLQARGLDTTAIEGLKPSISSIDQRYDLGCINDPV